MFTPWRCANPPLVPMLAWLSLVNALMGESPATHDRGAEAYRRHGLDPGTPLESRVRSTPGSVLAFFREAGKPAPKEHVVTEAELAKLNFALKALPPMHRRVLRERLRVVSFLDGMPNTALTSTVNPNEPFRLFDITINAKILRQNVSEWLTEKERTCFDATNSPLRVSVDAGTKFDALLYVLLHEATHVVDFCERITPPPPTEGVAPETDGPKVTAFTKGVWSDVSLPAPAYRDPLRERVRFYGKSGAISVEQAPEVYKSMRRTPFASLYGGRNALDDLAEFATVYHLTEVLKQPYRIAVLRGEVEVFVYEPMKSALVRRRIAQMQRFYESR